MTKPDKAEGPEAKPQGPYVAPVWHATVDAALLDFHKPKEP